MMDFHEWTRFKAEGLAVVNHVKSGALKALQSETDASEKQPTGTDDC